MRRLSTLLSFLVVFTVGSVALTLLRDLGGEERRGKVESRFLLPKADMVLSDVRFVDSENGRRNWTIESSRAELFKGKSLAAFEGVHITFFGKDGKVMHLYSNQGELDTSTRDMMARGDIRGQSSDGMEFFTSTLSYDDETRKISTDDPVKIVARGFETEGVGMVVDVDEERIHLLGQVRLMGSQ
jgi:LPS export ABC transporter protein LptC